MCFSDKWIAMYIFTGSLAVGETIKNNTGIRTVTLEPANNSPNIIHYVEKVKKQLKSN